MRKRHPTRPELKLAVVFVALGVLLGALSEYGLAARPKRSSKGPAPAPSASPSPEPPKTTEYHNVLERDFALRSKGELQVTNMRGDIVVQGWSLDKIRVKAKRRVLATSPDDAKRLFATVDFRFKAADSHIELAAEYGRGLTLQEKLRERENPHTGMEMVVYAPAHFKLRVWGVDGKITIKSWGAAVDARASSGTINVDGVKSGGASVLCPSCSIRLRSVNGPVRCMGGTGPIQIADVNAPHTYVESGEGALSATRVRGEQLYVTKEGSVTGRELKGRIEFHAGSAPVEILESEGFLSGRSTSGDIVARMREWEFADKAVIESAQGNIRLGLPVDFSGDIDLFSGKGRTDVGFPVEQTDERYAATRKPGHVVGRIGDGGELLKVFSSQGSVHLFHGGGT